MMWQRGVAGRATGALIAAAAIALGWSAPAQAWNGRGHMLVAAIAWENMTPATRNKAAALLQKNPLYASWVAHAPAGQAGRWAFIQAATWPDKIRGKGCDLNRDGKKDSLPAGSDAVWNGALGAICYYDDGSTPPGTPRDGRDIGYRDQLLHRYWHFKDIPFSPDGTALDAAEAPNAETQITAFRAILEPSSTANADERAYALAWLEHLVGDMHQPLHATSRFTSQTKHGDNGGNSVKVCTAPANCTKQKAFALHSFWDGSLGSGESIRGIVQAASQFPAPPTGEAENLGVDAWIDASFELAKSKAYVSPVGDGTGAPNGYLLTAAYRNEAARIATSQVALAGARLAKVLEEALN